ncbi:hypothetical protein AB9R81_08875 [Vibrio cyclitrophicus]|uniref:hypothetical protein n=1 Tax=Vibrio cyclitrophicus TaxID=47951 RepID=UPI000C838E60|nr:hypothetical protein BCU52_03040 [Vibrio cyclitrophicus]
MITRRRTIIVVLISLLSFTAGILSLKVGVTGLFPLFIVVISFFSFVINLYLLFFGKSGDDSFDAYQQANKVRSDTLVKGFDDAKTNKLD